MTTTRVRTGTTLLLAGALSATLFASPGAATPDVASPGAASQGRVPDAPPGHAVRAVATERTRPAGRVAVGEELAADLRVIAADRGLSYQAAVDRFAWQDDFARLVDEARTRFPDTYVTAEITHDAQAPAWIAFTEVPTGWVRSRLTRLPVAVEVRQTDGALTEIEQDSRVQRVHYAVRGLPGLAEVASSIDPISGQVSVTYTRASAGNQGRTSTVESRSGAAAATAPTQVASADALATDPTQALATVLPQEVLAGVVLEEVEGDLGEEEATLYGGAWLKQSGYNYCTSGFGVVKNGVRGILTAAHCAPPMNYGSSVPLYNKQATSGSQGDLRWLSTSEAVSNRVYSSSTGTVGITSVASPVAGQTLSFYGRTTGASTDEVYKLNECANGYCSLTMMHRHKTDNGDSGGPWRSGNTAYGVHHGAKGYLGISRSLFSRVGLANAHLGVAIKTSP